MYIDGAVDIFATGICPVGGTPHGRVFVVHLIFAISENNNVDD
jgi:hypothetical protein